VSYDPSGEYHVPTVYEWNLTVERQLPSNFLVRAAYVGTRSLHILETEFYNAAPFIPQGQPGCCTGKPGLGLANATVFAASGGAFGKNTFSNTVQADITDINSSYHSLQMSVEKRVSHGLTLLANYTYSKSLDDLPFGEGVSGFDTGYSALPFNDPNRHKFDYGPSSFDHTHVFVASYVYQTPSLKGMSSWVRQFLGDYEIGGIVSAASGRPITVLQGTEVSGTGIGNDRGTLCTGSGPAGDTCQSGTSPYGSNSCAGVTATCVSWLNPAAFEPTKAGSANNAAIFGTFGNVGKNVLRLPRTVNWDMSLSKYFNITERWRLQLRVEYFNIFNHPNFAPESTSTGAVNGTDQISAFDKLNNNSAFGTFRAGQAGDPRIAQLAAKIYF
jgi:hypothetical protein